MSTRMLKPCLIYLRKGWVSRRFKQLYLYVSDTISGHIWPLWHTSLSICLSIHLSIDRSIYICIYYKTQPEPRLDSAASKLLLPGDSSSYPLWLWCRRVAGLNRAGGSPPTASLAWRPAAEHPAAVGTRRATSWGSSDPVWRCHRSPWATPKCHEMLLDVLGSSHSIRKTD